MLGDVNEAFEILLSELDAALKDMEKRVATASLKGEYERAQTLLVQAQQMKKLITDVRAKQKDWQVLIGRPRRLQERKKQAHRLPPGKRTSEKAYRLPILRALVALGGEARVQDVLERVFAEMKNRLKPVDLEPLPSKKEPRWRNTAMWERRAMVMEGLLSSNSPYGIWTITERGKAYLRQHGE